MRTEFISKYINQYTIKEGTALYRRSNTRNILDEMFFAFCPFGTYSSYFQQEPIELWITITEIKGNLMLRDTSNPYKLTSSIPDIYNCCCPDEPADLMELKKFGMKRDAFVSFLKDKNISNWISSVEDKLEMELFLFSSQIDIVKQVKYSHLVDPSDDYDTMNSFDYSKISIVTSETK